MRDKKFRLHWLNGKHQDITGPDIVTAFHRAGIGRGALRALDYWEELP